MARDSELEAIAKAFKAIHPNAKAIHEWNLDGWAIQVQELPADWEGTMDPSRLMLFPLERVAGITVHIWDPRNPNLLQQHESTLKKAGFKVMVGCLQWNRKAPIDVGALADVFAATR